MRACQRLFYASLLATVTVAVTVAAEAGDAEPKHPQPQRSLSELTPAYHYRQIYYEGIGKGEGPPKVERIEEVWALRGTGRRVENRVNGRLIGLIVETTRWRFRWDPLANHVVAWASSVDAPFENQDDGSIVATRDEIMQWSQRRKATHGVEKEQRDGREVEKITFRFLADPAADFAWPIHEYVPEIHDRLLQSPGARFRTRTHWFGVKTGLQVGKQCGCQTPKSEFWVDYPAPATLSRDLFNFRVPRGATLEINDPTLGRQVHSEGQNESDLRP